MNWWDIMNIRRGWQIGFGDDNIHCFVFYQDSRLSGPFDHFMDAKDWAEEHVEQVARLVNKDLEKAIWG